MDTLYAWVDANIDKMRYILSANFLVLSVVLVLLRFYDGSAFFSIISAAAVCLCGYAMICGSVVVIQYRSLKVAAAHIDHFGKYEFDAGDESRGKFATKFHNLPKPKKNDLEEKFLSSFIGLIDDGLDFREMAFQDFEKSIEGAEARSLVATSLGVVFFAGAVGSFVVGTLVK